MRIRIYNRFGNWDWVLSDEDGRVIKYGTETSHSAAISAAEKARTHGNRTLGRRFRDGQ